MVTEGQGKRYRKKNTHRSAQKREKNLLTFVEKREAAGAEDTIVDRGRMS